MIENEYKITREDNYNYRNFRKVETLSCKSIQKVIPFTPNSIQYEEQIIKKKHKHKNSVDLNPNNFFCNKRKSTKTKTVKALEGYNENFNEIIKSLKNMNKDKNFRNNNKRHRTVCQIKDQNLYKNIKDYIKENEEDIKSLSNVQEISDFNEYNENCLEIINDLIPINKSKLSKIKFPFFDEMIKNNNKKNDNNNYIKKRIAIFDLDETLVHCEFKNIEKSQFQIDVKLPSKKTVKIGLNIRPHLKEALIEINKYYYIVIYTASSHFYADSVLDFLDDYIDPNEKYFKYRLYRSNCILCKVKGDEDMKVYVKDLDIFDGVSLKDMIIIDNSILAYANHLNNGIPIVPYYNTLCFIIFFIF